MQPNLSAGRQRLPDRSRKAAGGAHISRAASCGREQRELCVKGRERRGRNGAQRAPAGEREVVRKKERISSSAHLSKSRAAEPGRAGDRGKGRRTKAEAMEAVAFKVAACRAPASSEARARPERAEEEGPVRARRAGILFDPPRGPRLAVGAAAFFFFALSLHKRTRRSMAIRGPAAIGDSGALGRRKNLESGGGGVVAYRARRTPRACRRAGP